MPQPLSYTDTVQKIYPFHLESLNDIIHAPSRTHRTRVHRTWVYHRRVHCTWVQHTRTHRTGMYCTRTHCGWMHHSQTHCRCCTQMYRTHGHCTWTCRHIWIHHKWTHCETTTGIIINHHQLNHHQCLQFFLLSIFNFQVKSLCLPHWEISGILMCCAYIHEYVCLITIILIIIDMHIYVTIFDCHHAKFFFDFFLFFCHLFYCPLFISFFQFSFLHRIYTREQLCPQQPSRVGRLSFEIPRC